jgi:two-component system sensor histidine kinase/response regulator
MSADCQGETGSLEGVPEACDNSNPSKTVETSPSPAGFGSLSTRFIDAFPVPAAVFGAEEILMVNRPFASLLGASWKQLNGQPLARLWRDLKLFELFSQSLQDARRNGLELSLETRWERADRREIWIELKGRLMGRDEPEPGAWIVVANDISRHRRAQGFLQMQRNLIECSHDSISVVDVSSDEGERLVFVNSAWERMTGYAAEEVIGRRLSLLQRTDRSQEGSKTLRKAVQEKRPANVCLRNYKKNGQLYYVDVSVFPLPNEPGQPQQFVGISRDITKKRETELRLIESERRFRHLFADNRLPMLLVETRTGEIVDANAAAMAYYGYGQEAWKTLRLDDLVFEPEAPDELPKRLPGLGEQSLCHRMANGQIRNVMVYSGDLQVKGGAVRYVIVVDVTARHKAEAKLRSAIAAAESANVAKSEFLQVVGHEIRTPMNAISGFANLLKTAEGPAEIEESIEMILQGASDLTLVLDGVVDYIRWGSENAVGTDTETDPVEFALEALSNYDVRAKQKGLGFKKNWPQSEATMWMPSVDYVRMVGILLDNAIKFTAEGQVSFDVHVRPSSHRMVVRVSDTGTGIEDSLARNLFTPFCSGDAGTRRSYGGIGLGLALCSRMADAYGGRLHFQSRLGEGSTFVLDLPFRTHPPV